MTFDPPIRLPEGVQVGTKQMAPFVRAGDKERANSDGTPFPESYIQKQLQMQAPETKTPAMPESFETPAQRQQAIQMLMPTIRSAANKYAKNTDPITIGRAKLLVSKALPRYDSKRSDIKTFVDRQLAPLTRYSSRRSRKIRLPDRMQLDAMSIKRAEAEYEDEEGRPPTIDELQRATGLTSKRINAVRQADRTILSGDYLLGDEGESETRAGDLPVYDDEAASRMWVRIVREDLPPTDQFILDHSLGLSGQPILKSSQIAKRLQISPAAVSQRLKRIQLLLNREDELNPFR